MITAGRYGRIGGGTPTGGIVAYLREFLNRMWVKVIDREIYKHFHTSVSAFHCSTSDQMGFNSHVGVPQVRHQ